MIGADMHVLLIAVVALAWQATQPAVPERFAGDWRGHVQLPNGSRLAFGVTVNADATGMLDIPAQRATGIELTRVESDGESLTFAVDTLPGEPTWTGQLREDGRLVGKLKQGGADVAFFLERGTLTAGVTTQPARPQEPRGELPYDARDVTFPGGAEGVTLAGTLTLPRGGGPHPAAVLVSGSGPQDRDSTLFGHKPFLVLADRLTRAGVAVLRYDDRGVGQSTGTFNAATTDELAGDARAAVDFLARQPGVDPARIGIIGHSEGGLIGPMVAAKTDAVAFVVLLAGPGVGGVDLLERQQRDLLVAAGAKPAFADRSAAAGRALNEGVLSGADRPELELLAANLLRSQVGLPPLEAVPDAMRPTVAAVLTQVDNPWYRGFLAHDPADDLRATKVPVLALLGERDLQVSADQNAPALRAALADNPDATVEVVPGLNHLFQPATTGLPGEYATSDVTFDEATLKRIAGWIESRSQTP